MLAETVFTQDGRKYVHGTRADKCNFAYLERPRIESADGRLRIRARFTGRSALDMFGKCVGLGDAFGVVILGTPQYRDGFVTLTGVSVTSDGKTGYYIRRVCAALAGSLGHDFRYPLASEFQQALENRDVLPAYPRGLKDFRVSEVRVTEDALALVVDFQLTVK
jgi:outer membrane receptor protein involved in Fe transport